MKIVKYWVIISALSIALGNLVHAQGFSIKVVPDPEAPAAPPPPPPAPAGGGPPPAAPIPTPTEARQVIKVNVKNETDGKNIVFYTKLKPAEGQDPALVQPFEYLKVMTFVKPSATIANIISAPNVRYVFDRSRVWTHERKEDGTDEFPDKIDCRVNDNDLGKSASKSITFRIRKLPNDDVLSCVVFYDAD